MKTLIVDEMHPSINDLMAKEGFEADYCPSITRSEILEKLPAYEGLIIRSKTDIDMELLDAGSALCFIARAGAGLDKIDIAETKRRGIRIVNAPEGNRDAVGEHTLGMLLMLFNKLNTADIEVRNKVWRREANRGVELKGKTFGIIGYGNMGKAVAQRLSGFGCKVLAYDRHRTAYGNLYAEETDLETLQKQTDILSLHIPLNEANRDWINYDFLMQFNKPYYFINTARGELVKLSDIEQAFQKGKLLGAALDVLENEKLQKLTPEQEKAFQQLAARENVIFSPHVGGWTHESYRKINEVIVDKLVKLRDEGKFRAMQPA